MGSFSHLSLRILADTFYLSDKGLMGSSLKELISTILVEGVSYNNHKITSLKEPRQRRLSLVKTINQHPMSLPTQHTQTDTHSSQPAVEYLTLKCEQVDKEHQTFQKSLLHEAKTKITEKAKTDFRKKARYFNYFLYKGKRKYCIYEKRMENFKEHSKIKKRS